MTGGLQRVGAGLVGGLLLGAAGCGGGESPPPPSSSGTGAPEDAVVVAERWISETDTAWNVDTPALWVGGGQGRVLATGKESHDLRVFDLVDGRSLPPLGGPGSGPGDFLRPNAVVVVDDLALVVERDNQRVQVLTMPTGEPAGSFGEGVLEHPYGAVVQGSLPELTLWVTDDYETPPGGTPDYTRRIHRFRVAFGPGGTPEVRAHDTFGETEGEGVLAVVESIGLDPRSGGLLVADEARKAYLVYDTAGRYQGGAPLGEGRIQGDPEGLALVSCGPEETGYWIVTDQQDAVSYFRVFTREGFRYVGTFRGRTTANTDGVSFAPGPVPGFAQGVFLAVHDDQGVAAFDFGQIRRALSLPESCGLRG